MKSQISALMDGDVALEDAEYLYTTLKSGGETTQAWADYHLIGDAMRGNPVFNPDFTERLMASLDQEPILLVPAVKRKQALLKNSKLWSVAASVSAVAFVGWVVLQQQVQNGIDDDATPMEIAQSLPADYWLAHQSQASNNSAYYIQPANYSE
ncbi:sigma-E factor negative regulatory protein [Methylobacillus arboreus]|uniref:sigma-E factor negative regulatory protein n=1 Tax=Methylobacillus arboreus TaxID=755170 RepID=UPI001E2C43A1|nr:sigma-E factor negative regulatory protein [Methylobacillus arboreus]MCB5191675.1 sigma-E factor negative regulatory protein [Methylobacillus arboreus]